MSSAEASARRLKNLQALLQEHYTDYVLFVKDDTKQVAFVSSDPRFARGCLEEGIAFLREKARYRARKIFGGPDDERAAA